MDTKSLPVDGYVSQTFLSRRAEQYFQHLLRSSPIPLIEMVSYPDREGRFFLVGPITRRTLERPFDTSSQLLDRTVVNRGTVVPQTMWSPCTVTDKRQRVEEAALQMPVFFDAVDGRLGLSLAASAAGRCHGLRNAQQFVPLGQNSTTHVRIAWPDYKDFKCQVQIRDETDAFFKAYEPDPGCTDNRRKQWEIGLCGIRRNDIMVIGAIHISAGSWMPILQLSRYVL